MIDGVDAHVVVGTRDEGYIGATIGKGAADARPADEEAEDIVVDAADKLTVFFRSKDVAEGDDRIQRHEVKRNADGVFYRASGEQIEIGIARIIVKIAAFIRYVIGAFGIGVGASGKDNTPAHADAFSAIFKVSDPALVPNGIDIGNIDASPPDKNILHQLFNPYAIVGTDAAPPLRRRRA